MQFVLEQIRTGGDRNFAYLLGDRATGRAAIVDPSYAPEAVVERAQAQGLNIDYIINTHGHPDHTNGNAEATRLTGAPLAALAGSPVGPDVSLSDGSTLKVGSLRLTVFHVPGHCADHILLYLPEQKVALTGDLLFVGKIGGTRTDDEARDEYHSLTRALQELPDDVTVWPGHDYGCRPASTIALEKATNPFLLVKDFPEFLELKRDWSQFKKKNGLA